LSESQDLLAFVSMSFLASDLIFHISTCKKSISVAFIVGSEMVLAKLQPPANLPLWGALCNANGDEWWQGLLSAW
jgi:hypothetical protein